MPGFSCVLVALNFEYRVRLTVLVGGAKLKQIFGHHKLQFINTLKINSFLQLTIYCPGMVAHTYNSYTLGGQDGRIA